MGRYVYMQQGLMMTDIPTSIPSTAVTQQLTIRKIHTEPHVIAARALLDQELKPVSARRAQRRDQLVAEVITRITNPQLLMTAVAEAHGVTFAEQPADRKARDVADSIAIQLILGARELRTPPNKDFVDKALIRDRFQAADAHREPEGGAGRY